MQTYTITIAEDIDKINKNRYTSGYAGNTYHGFTLIDHGVFEGSYQGYAEGDEVIFYPDEIFRIWAEDQEEFNSDMTEAPSDRVILIWMPNPWNEWIAAKWYEPWGVWLQQGSDEPEDDDAEMWGYWFGYSNILDIHA